MLVAKIENGTVVDVSEHRTMFSNTSFPNSGPNAEFIADNGCMSVTVWKPYDYATEKLVTVDPYIEVDTVFTVAVFPLTQEELDALAAPPPVEPVVSISMRQARLALLQSGFLAAVDTAIAAMDEPARIEWEYATEVRRDNPLMAGMAVALGLDEAQVDALFVAASAL